MPDIELSYFKLDGLLLLLLHSPHFDLSNPIWLPSTYATPGSKHDCKSFSSILLITITFKFNLMVNVPKQKAVLHVRYNFHVQWMSNVDVIMN